MRRCDICRRRIWRWQNWGGVGLIGFRLRDAERAWHVSCARFASVQRHAGPHPHNAVCRLLNCSGPDSTEQ